MMVLPYNYEALIPLLKTVRRRRRRVGHMCVECWVLCMFAAVVEPSSVNRFISVGRSKSFREREREKEEAFCFDTLCSLSSVFVIDVCRRSRLLVRAVGAPWGLPVVGLLVVRATDPR